MLASDLSCNHNKICPMLTTHFYRSFLASYAIDVLEYTISPEIYISGLMQDCSNSIANAMELLQSYTEPSTGGRDASCFYGRANSGRYTILYKHGLTLIQAWVSK